ncbi:hypothetical protein CN13_09485 [Petrotoga sp. HKA.pet.4.5]|nr:hypothetical protein CN13_09485 [Petrotoga sp. HKA.pet.4.5]
MIYKYFNEDDRWDTQTITENLKNAMNEANPQKKPFYMSLRKILTDSFHGPDLINTIFLLGRNTVLERLQRVTEI